jgi:DnaJ-like protein
MSRGHGKVERRVGELFATTKDRALSVGDLARHAFTLGPDAAPDRKQRLSTTRAAHRLLQRAAAAVEAVEIALDRVIAETAAKLGREPGGRGEHYYSAGRHFVAVDSAFAEAMKSAPSWPAREQAWQAMDRERKRFDGVLVTTPTGRGGWRTTETEGRRLWFHPADFPVRVWAVAIRPEGVVWADTEITGIAENEVRVRYSGASARLDRAKLARSWTLYRNVFFTSARSGYAARSFDQMWQQQFWRPGSSGAPPVLQMLLADAIKLLGVPADFSREDIIAAFRRKALQCHPDHGGTEAQFIELVRARDRLLAALGTRAAEPKMPEFAPKGIKLRYGTWRPGNPQPRVGQTRRISVISR